MSIYIDLNMTIFYPLISEFQNLIIAPVHGFNFVLQHDFMYNIIFDLANLA